MALALGPHTLDALETGTLALDGGAMFGVVPRALWARIFPPDEHNRIRLAMRSLLIRTGGRVVLVDCGPGDQWTEKERRNYGFEDASRLDVELQRLGLGRSDVTDVILTHLHFDHCGGAVRLDEDGREVPAFPRATYHVQARNWSWARNPSDRDRASYRVQTFRALEHSGQLHLIDGEIELLPGIGLLMSEGHTPGLQMVRVSSGGSWLTYCADLLPTRAHLRPAWGMAYDLQPLVITEEKMALLAEAIEDEGILFLEHDPDVQACRVREENGEILFDEVSL